MPEHAFILAAGYGTRLRPYTDVVPKPMVEVGGVPMIDTALDRLAAVGVKCCCVNTHYKAHILQDHLQARGAGQQPEIVISHEDVLLDTGGGIKAALDCKALGDAFFVLSGDSVWEDASKGGGGGDMLRDLAAAWNPDKMDILMVLQPVRSMVLTRGVGDYDLDAQGRAVRSAGKSGGYMFTSVRINAARIFDDAPSGAFSYLELLDIAQRNGRLYGMVHTGAWHHISTPEDLRAVNAAFLGGRS